MCVNVYVTTCAIDSPCLQLDPTMGKVRAVPEKRCILILREMPKETPEEVILPSPPPPPPPPPLT